MGDEIAPEGANVVPFPDVGSEIEPDLDELRAALEGLRREIRARFQPAAVERGEIDWMELFEELRRRVSTLGMVERSGVVDEFGMDEVVMRRGQRLLDFLFDTYWRVDCHGLDRLEGSGPRLLVANRSGVLPYDGLMVAHAIERHHASGARPRFLVADWLITLPFVQPYLARLGGVRACRENADRLLQSGHWVLAFPEGEKGAAKVFRERYRVKRLGRGGVVRTALENRVPLVPVGVVGPEEAHPILFKWTTPARMVGLPFLPVTPTFPWLGPLGLLPLPTKWWICFGDPIPTDELGPEAAEDELLVSRLTEELRGRIESLLHTGLDLRPSVWS
ncbi:MAG: 1-acyl-sn-glycerol-3-phosphate acyltransferase [Proteobacteria bacterium]|nr:1-acyl-sn-glycerol-3-phosphate acyltransferase [Pseudomonadota bacterium]